MTERDPHELADALEQQTDALDREGREVQGQIDETREDWQRKRADESVPGAPPPEGESGGEGHGAGGTGADAADEAEDAPESEGAHEIHEHSGEADDA